MMKVVWYLDLLLLLVLWAEHDDELYVWLEFLVPVALSDSAVVDSVTAVGSFEVVSGPSIVADTLVGATSCSCPYRRRVFAEVAHLHPRVTKLSLAAAEGHTCLRAAEGCLPWVTDLLAAQGRKVTLVSLLRTPAAPGAPK